MAAASQPVRARETLVRIASEVGFPAPAGSQGLAEWADDVLDPTLVRGSDSWSHAHAHVVAALEAAMMGSESGVRSALTFARDVARSHGRRLCTCPASDPGRGVDVGPQRVCVKCGGRARR